MERDREMERVTLGDEKVSLTIVCKTRGDLLISQHSAERWFERREDAAVATAEIIRLFIEVLQRPTELRPEVATPRPHDAS